MGLFSTKVIDNSTGEVLTSSGQHRGRKGGGRGGNRGKHASDGMCTYTWDTTPKHPIPGVHYNHACINQRDPDRKDNQCGGTHHCRTWECSESK